MKWNKSTEVLPDQCESVLWYDGSGYQVGTYERSTGTWMVDEGNEYSEFTGNVLWARLPEKPPIELMQGDVISNPFESYYKTTSNTLNTYFKFTRMAEQPQTANTSHE